VPKRSVTGPDLRRPVHSGPVPVYRLVSTGLFKDRSSYSPSHTHTSSHIAEHRPPLSPQVYSKPPLPPQALHQTRVLNLARLARVETALPATPQRISVAAAFREAQARRSTAYSPVPSSSGGRDSFASSQVRNHKPPSLLATLHQVPPRGLKLQARFPSSRSPPSWGSTAPLSFSMSVMSSPLGDGPQDEISRPFKGLNGRMGE